METRVSELKVLEAKIPIAKMKIEFKNHELIIENGN